MGILLRRKYHARMNELNFLCSFAGLQPATIPDSLTVATSLAFIIKKLVVAKAENKWRTDLLCSGLINSPANIQCLVPLTETYKALLN